MVGRGYGVKWPQFPLETPLFRMLTLVGGVGFATSS